MKSALYGLVILFLNQTSFGQTALKSANDSLNNIESRCHRKALNNGYQASLCTSNNRAIIYCWAATRGAWMFNTVSCGTGSSCKAGHTPECRKRAKPQNPISPPALKYAQCRETKNIEKVFYRFAGDNTHVEFFRQMVTGINCVRAMDECKTGVRREIKTGNLTSWSHCRFG